MGGWSHWESNNHQPRISAATPCLTCGSKKGKHKKRHPFRPRFPNMTDEGTVIDSDTYEVGRGPIVLDVAMAREHGWSERTIVRVWNKLEKLAKSMPRRTKKRRRS